MPYKDKNSPAARESSRRNSAAYKKRHPERILALRKDHYARNGDAIRARQMKRHFAHRDEMLVKMRKHYLKRVYGLTVEQYEALGTACEICGDTEERKLHKSGKPYRMSVDHCHDTGKICGLLCGNCNAGIGHFDHDPDLMMKAIEYVKRTHAAQTA